MSLNFTRQKRSKQGDYRQPVSQWMDQDQNQDRKSAQQLNEMIERAGEN